MPTKPTLANCLVHLPVLVLVIALMDKAIRPPLEMTWPSLDQVKLVGVGLDS